MRTVHSTKGKSIPARQGEVMPSFPPRPSPPMGRDIVRTAPCEKRRLSNSCTSPASKHGRIPDSSSEDEDMGTGYNIPKVKPRYRDDPRPEVTPAGTTNFCDDCLSKGKNCHKHCRRCKRNLRCKDHSTLADPCPNCIGNLPCPKHCSGCTRFRNCVKHRARK